MTITAAQLEERHLWIGASEVPAICGVDPYRSAVDVWYSKVHGRESKITTEFSRAGDYAEEGLVRFAEDELGLEWGTAERNAEFKLEDGVPFVAHLDGWLPEQKIVVECKQTGEVETWGSVKTDAVPDKVMYQVQQQMYLSGGQETIVSVAFGFKGVKYVYFRVPRSQELIDHIVGVCQRFWFENVLTKVKPEGSVPRLETLKQAEREPELTTVLDQELVNEWNAARAAQSEWRKEKIRLDALILTGLECEGSDGSPLLAEIGLAEDGYVDYSPGPKGKRSLKWKAEALGPQEKAAEDS